MSISGNLHSFNRELFEQDIQTKLEGLAHLDLSIIDPQSDELTPEKGQLVREILDGLEMIKGNMEYANSQFVPRFFEKVKNLTNHIKLPESNQQTITSVIQSVFTNISEKRIINLMQQIGEFKGAILDSAPPSLLEELEGINPEEGEERVIEQFKAIMQKDEHMAFLANGNDPFLQDVVAPYFDFKKADASGKTLLHHLALKKNPLFTSHFLSLVKGKADMNARDEKGATPLYYAAGYSSPEFVRGLLQNGSDPKIKTETGQSPFNMAAIHEKKEAMIELQKAAIGELGLHFRSISTQLPKQEDKKTLGRAISGAAQLSSLGSVGGTTIGVAGKVGGVVSKKYVDPAVDSQIQALIFDLDEESQKALVSRINELASIESGGKQVSEFSQTIPFNAVNMTVNALALLANVNKASIPNQAYDSQLKELKDQVKIIEAKIARLGSSGEDEIKKGILLKDKELVLTQIKTLETHLSTQKEMIKAQCLRNAIEIGKSGSKALLSQEYLSDTMALSLLKYVPSLATSLTSAAAIYQNWNAIKDLNVRREQIQVMKQAVSTAYDELQKLRDFFPEGSFEKILLDLKAKNYEQKLAHLEKAASEIGYKKLSTVTSTYIYAAALMTYTIGLMTAVSSTAQDENSPENKMTSASAILATGGMITGFAPLIIGGAYATVDKLGQLSTTAKNLSSRAFEWRLSSEQRQERELIRQTAGQLGIEPTDLERRLVQMESVLNDEKMEDILQRAGIDTRSYDNQRRTLILQLLAQ
ncbi:ankyrin repeat domain-containing protein [Candidatus Protochlamydia phocaeensis]|uniref:ankyrin repeat domain-containing protein n=1 Tax=Candidatus Protochlamydia phocaeensis TaxID=1414722 RepID=UPI000838C187|nr:ankyrin repeat domain-containing protein [Candidatus Protochlamydia phocaeensis]